MKKFRKSHGRPFVRAREELHETKLEAAKLRENLVHEEYRIDVAEVYDLRQVQHALLATRGHAKRRQPLKCLLCFSAIPHTSSVQAAACTVVATRRAGRGGLRCLHFRLFNCKPECNSSTESTSTLCCCQQAVG